MIVYIYLTLSLFVEKGQQILLRQLLVILMQLLDAILCVLFAILRVLYELFKSVENMVLKIIYLCETVS